MRTSLPLLALVALLCLGTTGLAAKHRLFPDPDMDNDNELKPFQKNTEYSFAYNAQIASGLIAGSDEDASDPQQKAVTRIQCQAKIQFASERHGQLRLQQCRVGQQNEQMSEPEEVQPMGAFEQKQIPAEKQHQLQQPCQFTFSEGVIERVQFHEDEECWSKNIKRAVLNMIQLNLKRNNAQGLRAADDQGDEDEDPRQQNSQKKAEQTRRGKTFTIPEITLEGTCQTTYTINKAQGGQQYNVTKTINFKKCQKIADVAYGFQTQQPQPQCAECQQYWAQQQGGQNKQSASAQQQPQQQQQSPAQQNSEQHPCAKCDPKEVKEQELDRATVIRCQIRGEPTQKYALERCELLSQYVYRNAKSDAGKYGSAMQTVVAATLQARGAQPTNAQQIPSMSSAKDETLMFSNEWDVDVKRFYMFGDEEFSPSAKDQNSPFHQVPSVQQAEQALRKLVQSMPDNQEQQQKQQQQKGIDAQQAPQQLQRLVEMLRMSTQPELKRIEQQTTSGSGSMSAQMGSQQKQQAKQILTDALALCGTRNCVAELAQKIKNKECTQAKAVQALLSLAQLPAPSDAIVKQVEQLCKSDSVHAQPAVKQSCWLTFGALVNELCQHKTQKNAQQAQGPDAKQSGFAQQDQCPMDKKQQYKEAMLSVYQNSNCIYDKMVALSALGNAGLDISVGDLERIIKNPAEPRVVRVKAIDALRRLRTQMARKIQRILLPIFQHVREQPQVRTAAFAIMMYTRPEPQVVDQLMFTIGKEPNKQVQAFAYKTMKMMAKSQNPNARQIAKHIKSALKMANVDEQQLRAGSGKWQVPLYDQEQQEGVFVTLASTISQRSALPVYAHAQLDSEFSDQFQINQVKLYMMQQEAEQWYQNVAAKAMSATRGQRYLQQNRDSLRKIYEQLGIKSRRSSYQQQDNSELSAQNAQPFAMLAIRTNDVDRGFCALDEHIMAPETRAMLNGEQKPSLAHLLSSAQKQLNGAMATNGGEREAKIPTSAGVPLRVLNSMPMLANIDGQVKVGTESARLESPLGVQLDINAKASACLAHIQKMECWTPFCASGVQSVRAVAINAPLHAEVNANPSQGISIKVKLPQHTTQLVSAHALPITYTATVDAKSELVREPKHIRTIHAPKLERQQHDVNTIRGQKTLGMPLHIKGHYHWPAQPTNYQQFVQLLMGTENAVHVTYQPGQDAPREAIFRVSGAHFQKGAQQAQPELGSFYADEFDSPYACGAEQCAQGDCDQCEEFGQYAQQDAQELGTRQQRQQQLQKFIGQYSGQQEQYKHSLKLSAQTAGGTRDAKAQCEIQAQCDARLQYCKVQVEAERTPTAGEQQQPWKLEAQAQLVMPQTSASAAQLLQQQLEQEHKQFICQAQASWGQQQKQRVDIRVQGTQAHTGQVRAILAQQQQDGKQLISTQQLRNFQRRAAFLNKFQLQAQYTLKAQAQNAINRALEVLKSAYFWNTKSQLTGQGAQQNGQVSASIVIDPITQRHANVTIRTPAQQVRLQQIELPTRVRPFPLIRQQSAQQTHSLGQLFSRISVSGRAQCKVDGQRVNTFDNSDYSAPLSANCYSVLAKDCGSEQPQFAVLMKKLQQGQRGQFAQKKLKVITPSEEIECQPKHQTTSQNIRQPQPLTCKVNGQQVTDSSDSQQAQDASVQFNNAQKSDVTIHTDGGISVRFNGRKAWLKVAPGYKQSACGLCAHYDESGDAQDEWRMPDGQIARAPSAQFHRAYTMQDTELCTPQALDSFYNEQQQDDDDAQDSYYRQLKQYQQQQQDDDNSDELNQDNDEDDDQDWRKEQFDGQFDSSEEYDDLSSGEYGNNSDEDQDDRDGNPFNNIFGIAKPNTKCCCCCDYNDAQCQQNCQESAQCRKKCARDQCPDEPKNKPCCCCCDPDDDQCQNKCKQTSQCERKCQRDQCPDNGNKKQQKKCKGPNCNNSQRVSPVWKTKVLEQNHAVCFSTQPVKQCPRGSVPANRPTSDYGSDEDDDAQQQQQDSDEEDSSEKTKSVPFVCMPRADPETRRLLRQLRGGQRVVDVGERGSSFAERVREPQQCERRRF